MRNILRSLFYSSCKKSIMIKIFVIMLLFVLVEVFVFSFSALGFEGPTAGEFSATNIYMISVIGEMFIILNTCWLCTADFVDKTANYELMSGSTRFESYTARVLFSLIMGLGGFLLLFIVPAIFASVIWGWGSCIYIREMVFRWFMLIFPAARIIIEFAAFSFFIRKPAVAAILGFMIYTIINNLSSTFSGDNYSSSFLLGITNLSRLSDISYWPTYGLNKIWLTFDASLPASLITGTIIFSLAASVLFFFIGYTFFRYDDME